MTEKDHPHRCLNRCIHRKAVPEEGKKGRFWNKCEVLNGEITYERESLVDACGCCSFEAFKPTSPAVLEALEKKPDPMFTFHDMLQGRYEKLYQSALNWKEAGYKNYCANIDDILSAFSYINEIQSKNDQALKIAQAHMKRCTEKFQKENPCPMCGSHNTDIDWGTPIYCRNCHHTWE